MKISHFVSTKYSSSYFGLWLISASIRSKLFSVFSREKHDATEQDDRCDDANCIDQCDQEQ